MKKGEMRSGQWLIECLEIIVQFHFKSNSWLTFLVENEIKPIATPLVISLPAWELRELNQLKFYRIWNPLIAKCYIEFYTSVLSISYLTKNPMFSWWEVKCDTKPIFGWLYWKEMLLFFLCFDLGFGYYILKQNAISSKDHPISRNYPSILYKNCILEIFPN